MSGMMRSYTRPIDRVTPDLLLVAAAHEIRCPTGRELDWLVRADATMQAQGWRAVVTCDGYLEWVPPGHQRHHDPTCDGYAALTWHGPAAAGPIKIIVASRIDADPEADFDDVTPRTISQLRAAIRDASMRAIETELKR
jgi:hypothetical protein